MSDKHPVQRLEDTVHQRVRLGILALLHDGGSASFTELRDALQLNDGTLSRHLGVLEQARYIAIEKGYEGKRPRTTATITDAGRDALAGQVRTLSELMQRFATRAEPGGDARDGGRAAEVPAAGERERGDDAERTRAMAAIFAAAVLASGERRPRRATARKETAVTATTTRMPMGLGRHVVDEAPHGFRLIADAPLNRFYEFPVYEHIRNTFAGGYEQTQQRFIAMGLRSGYWRNWSRPGDALPDTISVQVLEFADEASTANYLKAIRSATKADGVDVGVDGAAGYVNTLDAGFNAWCWFAAGTLLGLVVCMDADRNEACARLAATVAAQHARLADARLEPAR